MQQIAPKALYMGAFTTLMVPLGALDYTGSCEYHFFARCGLLSFG